MIDGYNSDISSEQVQKLAELFPEVVTEGRVDFDKLRATLGDDIDLGERYGLTWKGKSGVFATIQEKTVSTLHPQPEESVDWDTTQNMFIEGDNLEALKVLHKAYYGKVKMIYIDPPYNTGNDFVYNDDFKVTKRQQALEDGSIDDEGNVTRDDGLRVNTGGHKHSNWLDMMYPRLFLARNLLRQDGVIFVSIDDNEVHSLRLMMNEIFGEENFIAQFIWRRSGTGGLRGIFPVTTHEYVVAYARRKDNIKQQWLAPYTKDSLDAFTNEDDKGKFKTQALYLTSLKQTIGQSYYIELPDGTKAKPPVGIGSWRFIETTYKEELDQGNILFKKVSGSPLVLVDGARAQYNIYTKQYISDDGTNPATIFPDEIVGQTRGARAELKKLFDADYFEYAKPTALIKYLVSLAHINNDDIIIDFFSGSGTLAHAVSKLNAEDGGDRRWIMVQLAELTDEESEVYKAGYKTIADIASERIRRAGAKIRKDFADKIAERETPLDLGFRSYKLGDSNFKKWNELVADPGEIRQATLDQLNPLVDGISDEDLLTEILLKRGISPLAEVVQHGDFVSIPSESIVISLSRNMTEQLFATILAAKPSQIILLDQAFDGDVNRKTNLILQAEKQGVGVEVL